MKTLSRQLSDDDYFLAESLGLSEELLEKFNEEFVNPLVPKTKEERNDPRLHLLRIICNPKYFGFTCKYILNVDPEPIQLVILKELWKRKYPMLIATRGGGKSFILAVYTILKCLLNQGSRVIVVGAAFRQAKVIFEYCDTIWQKAPILKNLVGYPNARNMGPKKDIDRCTFRLGDSLAVFIPLGDGSKIRGQRATVIIKDEYASIPKDILETVVSGFASVSKNPREAVKLAAKLRVLKRKGRTKEAEKVEKGDLYKGNQEITAGTAFYGFNHFAQDWLKWKAIVESRGNVKKLNEIYAGQLPDKFNYRSFSVMRIPAKILPPDFMDEEHVAKSQATADKSIYQMEYGAVFAMDSGGFFPRSLIEKCVINNQTEAEMPAGVTRFSARLRGEPDKEHVFAVDPAFSQDNFCILILELYPTHRRIVYCWTYGKQRHKELIKKNKISEKNYYGYCAKKIRSLMRLFPCKHISIDAGAGGGGESGVYEALNDPDKMLPGEEYIWETIDDKNPKDTDRIRGLHILELVKFARAEWVYEANVGLKKDMEDRRIVFPYFDPVQLALAAKKDKIDGREFDTLEDAVMDIEELKSELTTIVHTQTPSTSRDKWDTPEVKAAGGRKGRMRKDRYSSLLMANMAARNYQKTIMLPANNFDVKGGFAAQLAEDYKSKTPTTASPYLYSGPEWFVQANRLPLGRAVLR